MKTIVVYKSKSGFVKKYAEWIAEALFADIFEASEVTIDRLLGYDTIVYGGGLYAVGINGVKLITRNMGKLKNMNVIVFATGVSSPRAEVIEAIRNKNFTAVEQKNIRFFYLRGGFDYNKLNLIDKGLMNLLKLKLKSKTELTPDEKGMLAAYNTPVDFTKKKNTYEILRYVDSMKKE